VVDQVGWGAGWGLWAPIRLRPFLENIFLEKFREKNNFLEKCSRNSRKKSKFQLVFFILVVF
jgi:hypothetical protein